MFTKVYKMGNKLGFYFPKLQQIYQKGELLLLTLRKDAQEVTFLAKYNYNVIIRKVFVQQLQLHATDKVELHIAKIQSLSRTSSLFSKNAIDLLSCIPKKTHQGYDILVNSFLKDETEWLRLWYSHSRGSGRQLELKRFVNIHSFGSLLGQYQAEGTKHKKNKSKYVIEFANKVVKEHIDFLDSLAQIGIGKEEAEFWFVYNNILGLNRAHTLLKEFELSIGLPVKHIIDNNKNRSAFKCIIRNTLLTETILYAMDKVRTLLAKTKRYTSSQQLLVNAFFAKLVTGDGTLDIRTKDREYNYPSTRIRIVNQDENYLQDYHAIMENLGFLPKIIKEYILVQSTCNFSDFLYLYKIKAFRNTTNWFKILTATDLLLKGRRLSTLKRYFELISYKQFTTTFVSYKYNILTGTARAWLEHAVKEGYIIRLSERSAFVKEVTWTTTEKARNLVSLLQAINLELTQLKNERNIQDSLLLLESLKTKNKKKS